MAAPSGIAGQIGWKSETTWGSAVTVDTFHPGLLNENIKQDIARVESQGIRSGRRVGHTYKAGAVTVAGPINVELFDTPMATLLTHMFGSVTTTGAGPYTHTATPGTLTGKSLTIQVGRPDVSGTVQPFTYAGCKFGGWNLTCESNAIPKLQLDVTAKSEVTATGLASASYPASAVPFVFTEASLSIGGSSVATVNNMNLQCAAGLKADRFKIGTGSIIEQLESSMRAFTGTIQADFESLTAYNRFVNMNEAALVMAFTGSTNSLTITCNVRFDGETPGLSGIETLGISLPFKCTSTNSDASAVTAVLVNSQSSAA